MALRTQQTGRQDAMAGWWPSSFFVSSTAVNPTLTIIANALRVADHIAVRLGATGQPGARPEPVPAHA
jgi:choline dehydrogenase-like flavoprotein